MGEVTPRNNGKEIPGHAVRRRLWKDRPLGMASGATEHQVICGLSITFNTGYNSGQLLLLWINTGAKSLLHGILKWG